MSLCVSRDVCMYIYMKVHIYPYICVRVCIYQKKIFRRISDKYFGLGHIERAVTSGGEEQNQWR